MEAVTAGVETRLAGRDRGITEGARWQACFIGNSPEKAADGIAATGRVFTERKPADVTRSASGNWKETPAGQSLMRRHRRGSVRRGRDLALPSASGVTSMQAEITPSAMGNS
jgi:hypothetical protein